MAVALRFREFVPALARRAAVSHGARLIMLCLVFAALLAAGFHSGRDFASMLRVAFSQQAHFGTGGGQGTNGGATQAADPDGGFTETRVGQLLYPSHDSDTCRRFLFDNRSGASFDAGEMACGVVVPEKGTNGQDKSHDRIQAMIRAFRK